MIRIAFLSIALLWAAPADAGCFLFFCSPRHHHLHHHYHRHSRVVHKIIVKKTIVKKITVVHERKARGPAVDLTPITPLK